MTRLQGHGALGRFVLLGQLWVPIVGLILWPPQVPYCGSLQWGPSAGRYGGLLRNFTWPKHKECVRALPRTDVDELARRLTGIHGLRVTMGCHELSQVATGMVATDCHVLLLPQASMGFHTWDLGTFWARGPFRRLVHLAPRAPGFRCGPRRLDSQQEDVGLLMHILAIQS